MDCSYRIFFPYNDPLTYGLNTMVRGNIGVVVKMTSSLVWVIDVVAAHKGICKNESDRRAA